jgi:hypothetical protein
MGVVGAVLGRFLPLIILDLMAALVVVEGVQSVV